jgi:hypothetical protein
MNRTAKNVIIKHIFAHLFLNISLDLDEEEKKVLALLQQGNSQRGVKNKVVVTHELMLPYMKEHYPAVEVVASCLQAVNPRLYSPFQNQVRNPSFQGHYPDVFRDYDFVVPLNQHTTSDFLKQFRGYAPKMILFIGLECATNDLKQCFWHLQGIEYNNYPSDVERTFIKEDEIPDFLSSKLPKEAEGCPLYYIEDRGASLLRRQEDFKNLLKMGVNKFKIPRYTRFCMDFCYGVLKPAARLLP